MASVEELVIKISAENSDLKAKLKDSEKAVGGLGGMVSKLGPMVAGAFAVGSILAFGKASFAAFEEQEKANKRLMFALGGNKQAFKELTDQSSKFQASTGVSEESISQVQMLGKAAGLSISEIKKITEASLNLSSATGKDLQSSYEGLIRSLNGNGKALKMLGPEFSALTEQQLKQGDAIDLVIKKYAGFAEASATASEKMKANWGEIQEQVGGIISTVLSPLMENLSQQMRAIGNADMSGWEKFWSFIDVDTAENLNKQYDIITRIRGL